MPAHRSAETDVAGIPNVAQAIAAVVADIGPIGKDSTNPQQGFKYRGIEAVVNHLNPLLAKHGVVIVPDLRFHENSERPTSRGGTQTLTVITMGYRVYGPDGDYVEACTMGMALDTSDKSGNKAMTAAYKYLLAQLFAIPFADLDDVDKDSIQRVAEGAADNTEALAKLDALAANAGKTREEVSLRWRTDHNGMDMETFNALPPSALAYLIADIERYQRLAAKAAEKAAESPSYPDPAQGPDQAGNGAPAPAQALGEPRGA